MTLNAAVAAALDDMYAAMKAKGNANDPRAALKEVVIDVLKKHHRIMFNGDGYSAEWVTEAAKRGLPNYNTTLKELMGREHADVGAEATLMDTAGNESLARMRA